MSWSQEAQDLLQLSVAETPPNMAGVAHAMDLLELPENMVYPEAHRFLLLIDYPESKIKALLRASTRGSHWDVQTLIEQASALKRRSSAEGAVNSTRRKALTTPEATRALSFVRQHEKDLVEIARANEALAKAGEVPTWSARSHRTAANAAKAARIAAEDAYLEGL